MRRLALALLLALPAVPATADAPGQVCAAVLPDARAGQSTGCDTLGYGRDTWRGMTVVVTNGIVVAEVGCGGDPVLRETRRVAGPGRATATVPRDSYCWVILTAETDGASAVAESHPVLVLR